jgi:hypothetical protein
MFRVFGKVSMRIAPAGLMAIAICYATLASAKAPQVHPPPPAGSETWGLSDVPGGPLASGSDDRA